MRELEFSAVDPDVGGASGKESMNDPSLALKLSSLFWVFTSRGSVFQYSRVFQLSQQRICPIMSLQGLLLWLLKELEHPCYKVVGNAMLMSFGQIPCKIFQTCIIM